MCGRIYNKMMPLSHEGKSLASYIDHTLLRADAVARNIETLCAEAHKYGFFGVCVNNSWVPLACRLLSGTGVTIVSVAGFPLGASSVESKCFETGYAFDHGAREIDVVLNIGRLKQGDNLYIEKELAEIVKLPGNIR
jgi:deoxyribose-phosphate aldolase